MRQIATGVDLVEVKRIENLIERYGNRFAARLFTATEIETCGRRSERLAARFAAKEAVSKALRTGIGQISWQEIEIVNAPSGQPEVVLRGAAAELARTQGLTDWAISLSHTRDHAIAFVIASAG